MEVNQNEVVVTTPESGTTAVPETVNNNTPPEDQEPRTFTQEELDKIVGAEKAKLERKLKRELAQQAAEPQAPAAPPRPDQFTTAEEYVEALADYKAEQKVAERETQQQRKQLDSTYADREEDARTKYADFQEVVYDPTLRITNEMAEVVKESDIGPEIFYHLGKNPDEAARIARLSPLAQAREIGKIEAALAANPSVKKTSSAPEPIKPVGSRAATPKYDTTDPRSVSTMSTSEWIKAENERRAKLSR